MNIDERRARQRDRKRRYREAHPESYRAQRRRSARRYRAKKPAMTAAAWLRWAQRTGADPGYAGWLALFQAAEAALLRHALS